MNFEKFFWLYFALGSLVVAAAASIAHKRQMIGFDGLVGICVLLPLLGQFWNGYLAFRQIDIAQITATRALIFLLQSVVFSFLLFGVLAGIVQAQKMTGDAAGMFLFNIFAHPIVGIALAIFIFWVPKHWPWFASGGLLKFMAGSIGLLFVAYLFFSATFSLLSHLKRP